MDYDKVRWHATVVAKVGGAKKIRRPKDLMKLPLIDGDAEQATKEQMIEFLKAQKAGGG